MDETSMKASTFIANILDLTTYMQPTSIWVFCWFILFLTYLRHNNNDNNNDNIL